MPVKFVKGDLFDSDADALVNAVNTVGVMGGGIALQFKERFPEYYAEYRTECKHGNIRLGRMHVHHTEQECPRYIVDFPTKGHYRTDSTLAAVETGLQALRWVILALELESIAIPALGCGLGGLEWSDVRPLLLDGLCGNLDGCRVICYEPQ